MLTPKEIALTKKLGECFKEWCALEGHHPMDKQEFCTRIHDLQNMVMARSAARSHPEVFPNVLKVKS